MSKPFSSFPDVKIHRYLDPSSMREAVGVQFVSDEHFEAYQQSIYQKGYEKGKAEGLVDLQREARTLFKNVFGKDL